MSHAPFFDQIRDAIGDHPAPTNTGKPVTVGEILTGRPPSSVREQRVRSWLKALDITPPDEILAVLANADSGPETLLATQFARHLGIAAEPPNTLRAGNTSLELQAVVKKYRVDLLFTRGHCRLGVEVDGMEWHHQTEEQVTQDYLRQRRLTAAGLTIVRFTAREIYRDAAACWRPSPAGSHLDCGLPRTRARRGTMSICVARRMVGRNRTSWAGRLQSRCGRLRVPATGRTRREWLAPLAIAIGRTNWPVGSMRSRVLRRVVGS